MAVARHSVIADRGGEKLLLYPEITVESRRGDSIVMPDMENPVTLYVNASTDRQSDAELVGQVSNKVLKVIARKAPVGSWARAYFRDEWWDLAAPPTFSNFTRRVRHVEFILRSRNITEDFTP